MRGCPAITGCRLGSVPGAVPTIRVLCLIRPYSVSLSGFSCRHAPWSEGSSIGFLDPGGLAELPQLLAPEGGSSNPSIVGGYRDAANRVPIRPRGVEGAHSIR